MSAGIVTTKPGVQFAVIAPGGFRLLAAIHRAAETLRLDLVITSGTDGIHSGPNDPHKRGEAYDVRTHNLTDIDKQLVLAFLQHVTGSAFFAFLEAPGSENEHIHCQVAKGTTYPKE